MTTSSTSEEYCFVVGSVQRMDGQVQSRLSAEECA